ncbi:hypothetical protein [Cynomolgus macaque cytomegalovirus strain Mauritius]|uniref:Uncharacterized protein n=1 Tax=Cynomolgus macaque cytomegalovirus strain Mauritius TaxID=1690255 RepID=A0A0K1H0A2_9BETA|nr:hypothetical protein [Cynomolgus macaque cytomegalovirus strain Mauritius]AXG21729.1 hypothetical protein [synthetic construct]AXG21997.1 hypothetical protein [synthetic construct]
MKGHDAYTDITIDILLGGCHTKKGKLAALRLVFCRTFVRFFRVVSIIHFTFNEYIVCRDFISTAFFRTIVP